MHRKIVAVWVSLLIIVGSIIIILEVAPQVKGNIIYVGGANPGNFSKIQEGINAANPGDTVYVYSGTYYENVVVDKTIVLLGENKDSTIINGSGNGNVVEITANSVIMSEFTVCGGGSDASDAGILLSNVINCQVFDNIVEWNNQEGILLSGSDNNIIFGNLVHSNGHYGIYVRFCDDNSITANNASMNYYGMLIYYAKRTNVADNIVMSNSWAGIYIVSFCDDIDVLRNNISYSRYGIYMGVDGGYIAYNNISNNDCGIHLSSRWINVIENKMTNNGIFLTGSIVEFWNLNYIDSTNTINGKPVCFIKNQTGGFVPPGYGQVILANCTNVDVANLDFSNATVGIELGFSSNNNIMNNNVSNSFNGMYLENSHSNNIVGNTIQSNEGEGIYIKLSDQNNISNNHASNNTWGISVEFSEGNNINANEIQDNQFGIRISYSDENNITGMRFYNNSYGVYMYDSNRNNISNNIGLEGINHISISSCDGNNITNNILDGGSIILFSSYWNNITKNNVNNSIGICLVSGSKWNNITNNIASDNEQGIFLDNSNWNNIEENYGVNNTDGIEVIRSDDNDFTKNNFTNCKNSGVYLEFSDGNNINGNNASDAIYGIYLWVSNENKISENEVNSNILYGFYSRNSLDNLIYHNNIINNTNQAYDDGDGNYWDDGYPSGGNYWSDYIGNDSYKGPNQDQPGSDGIGDTNYSIDLDSLDHYPFLDPYIYKPFENYLTLIPGWNLISVPLIQENHSLIKVLEMIDGYYDAVQLYDPTDNSYHWKDYKVGKVFGNDLFELNENISFWIHITQPGNVTFIYNGTDPNSNQTIQLFEGWNMVGYPSLSNHNRTIGLNNIEFGVDVDCLQWYDAATKEWHFMDQDDSFVPGRGYWMHSKVDATWEVPL